jgi:2-oxoisovalerate dehydrogenase E1 component beta subunit
MPEVTLVEAINLALARALTDDPNVVVFGEDVGVNGGVFRATVGLQQRFGVDRVFDTPLSEALIAGLCVGMAAQGLRPVAEIQFMGFFYPCIDQIGESRLQASQSNSGAAQLPYGFAHTAWRRHSRSRAPL